MTRSIHSQNRRYQRSTARRAGFLYVAVLFTTLIVMIAASAALTISTTSMRGETDRSSRGQALRLAESGIQRQAAIMRAGSSWRSQATNNTFTNWYSITVNGVTVDPASQLRHRFNDPDGDLNDDLWDAVELTVHAKSGRAEAAVTVQLEPDPVPLDLLGYGLTATDDLRLDSGVLSSERPVQVNDDCRGYGIVSTPRLECSGDMWLTLRGDLAAASVVPPPASVVAKYVSLGTEIPSGSIPQSGGNLIIRDVLLTATNNPFGATDQNGIYWINAGGNRLIIAHSRLQATLAVFNAWEIRLEGGINWTYPTSPDLILATDSLVRLENVESELDEVVRSVNFNPPGSPYRGALANATASDQYPTEMRGIIYSSSNLRVHPLVGNATLRLTGALIARDVRIDGRLAIDQLDEFLDNPPPGLADPTPMRFIRGTFRRIPTP